MLKLFGETLTTDPVEVRLGHAISSRLQTVSAMQVKIDLLKRTFPSDPDPPCPREPSEEGTWNSSRLRNKGLYEQNEFAEYK